MNDRCDYCLHFRSRHLDNESGALGLCRFIDDDGDGCNCDGYLDSTLPDTIEEKRGER